MKRPVNIFQHIVAKKIQEPSNDYKKRIRKLESEPAMQKQTNINICLKCEEPNCKGYCEKFKKK